MSAVTTHVLDTATGRPATGVPVRLDRADGDGWAPVGSAVTDADGRVAALGPDVLVPSTYRLVFDIAAYSTGQEPFYPEVTVTFRVSDGGHYHVPLLLSPFGYSTYRGS